MKGVVCTKNIYLRPIESDDIGRGWLKWVNNPQSVKYLAYGKPSTRRDLEASRPPDVYMFAVCLMEDDRYIGNARLSSVDWINRKASYGRLLGDEGFRGKGVGTEMLVLLAYYSFYRIGLNRIETGVVENNIASIRSNEKAGAIQEGLLRKSEFINGKYCNVVKFGMIRNDFDSTNWRDVVCEK